MRKKKSLISDPVFLAAFFVLLGGIVLSGIYGYRIWDANRTYQEGDDIYSQAAEAVSVRPSPLPTEEKEITTIPEKQTEETVLQPEPTESIPEEKPLSMMDFSEIRKTNDDVIGWIRLDGTRVDYPVVQGKDNDFYLYHAINGVYNKVGAPFMDFRNKQDFSDQITVVYAHYMENGSMFTDLHQYKGQKFYDAHKTAMLYTIYGDYEIEFFAGVIRDVTDWDFTFNFDDDKSFLHYMNNWKLVSTFKNDMSISASDRFIVLSFCTYDVENGRFLLVGRLNPIVY